MKKYLNLFLKNDHIIIYLAYSAIILFVYFPLMSQHYAMSDDYAMIDIAIGHVGNLLNWDIINGRPIYGIFQYLVQYHMVTISRLSYLRSFSVLSTIILSCFIYKFLFYKIKVSSPNFVRYLPVFLIFAPAIVIYNSWASCFVYILSIFLAGLAFDYMFDDNKKTTIFRFIVGIICLICSFFIYQPTAMLFIYFVFLSNCIDSRKIKLVNLLISAVALMIAMVVSLISVKIVPKLLYGFTIKRSELNTDFFSKIGWYVNKPLRMTINNYNISPGYVYTTISIILLFIGFYCIFRGRQGVLKILLTLLLMVVIMAPNLLVKESRLDIRSSIGLYFIIITVIVYGLTNISEKYLANYNIKIVFGSMLLIVGIYTQYYMYDGIIRQQQAEYQALVQEMVTSIPRKFTGLIRFNISDKFQGAFTRFKKSGEVGQTSIQVPWALRGIAQSIKQLKGFDYQIDNSDLVLVFKDNCKKNCIIIRCADILKKAKDYKYN